MKNLVDAANALGTMIDAATKISPNAADRGPLAGDYNARQLMIAVRDAIAAPLTTASGTPVTASVFGVSLNKDGTIDFDQAKLTATLATSRADVLSVLGRSVGSTATGRERHRRALLRDAVESHDHGAPRPPRRRASSACPLRCPRPGTSI